ncbi:hypothetical protein MRB53_003900 [Persea americana]|uniref:Uncharacterized protein n=1 Tax=Persea americana TaxID=3435 RepID=A0ACC2MYI8_PERAE|nr:hypothetical protein MRB53_003900 [Persea americana]
MLVTSISKEPRPFFMPSCHYHIPMILHGIVGPSGEQWSNQSPLVPMNAMCARSSSSTTNPSSSPISNSLKANFLY